MSDFSETIIAHYERHARSWEAERNAHPFIEQRWFDAFARLLPKGGSVLDLGCGSGKPVVHFLIENGFNVTGVDSSPTMISLCKERLPDQEWIIADMRSLALGKRFDGILAWDSFFHLSHDNQRKMFGIFAAHGAPSAALMFTSGPEHAEAIGEYKGDPLYHASLARDDYEGLLTAHGFSVVSHQVEDKAAGGRTIWLSQLREQV